MKTRDKTPGLVSTAAHDVCVARGKAFNQQILRASLLACLLALVSGCAARTKHASADYVNSAFDRELAPPATHASATPDAADLAVYTFSQACERASRFDQDVTSAVADAARLELDVDQARSMIWPRLDVRTYFQLPLGGENLEDVQHFNGGVYFRYDFQKMIFSGDATTAARAKAVEGRERLGVALDHLSENLFLMLADRESLRSEVALRHSIQSQTAQTLERVHLLEKSGVIKPQRVLEYQYQYENSNRLYQDAVRRLAEANRALGRRLLSEGTQDIVITDLPQLLSSMEAQVPASNPDLEFFRGVWERRHDTKAAEADLFVKEMAVVDEKRKRIPTLNASLGFGSLSLSSTFSQAPVVAQFGATMPLLDFGDIKREIGKATIERDLARRKIDLLVLNTQRGVLDSSAALREAVSARETVEGQWKLITAQSAAGQKLFSAGVVDPIDLLNLRVRALESEIELTRDRTNVFKAAAEYAVVSGQGLACGPPAPTTGKAK